MLAPCKGCTERHSNCWPDCEKYAEFKSEFNRVKDAERKIRDRDGAFVPSPYQRKKRGQI